MSKKFWLTYKILIIIISAFFVLVLGLLWTFLASFEKCEPQYIIENVINNIEKKDYEQVYINKNISIENQKIIDEEINKKITEKITYNKKVSTNENEQIYSLRIKNKEIGSIVVEKNNKKNIFGITKWSIKSIDGLIPPAKTIFVHAPKNVQIKVNNNLVNEKQIISNDILRKDLVNVSSYTNIELLDKYEIKDIYGSLDVKCIYEKTEYLPVLNKDYYCDYPKDDVLLEAQKDYLIDLSKIYTSYVVKENNFYAIAKYVINTSHAYNFLKNISTTNIWLANHTPTEFSEFSFSNFQKYNEELYSVKVLFSYHFYVGEKEFNYPTTLTFFMLKVNGQYYIVDLMTI